MKSRTILISILALLLIFLSMPSYAAVLFEREFLFAKDGSLP